MNNKWRQTANNFYLDESSNEHQILPKGVYKLNFDTMRGCLYNERISDNFKFDYKLYGLETSFINRVIKTYNNTKGNSGILLNGTRGTGKTVTAKQIANKLDLPIVIVHSNYEGIPSFINEFQQDTIIFFDEYEKVYNDYDHFILTIMDGILDNNFRKVFLLTTNDLHVNANLLQRPGRIRYLNKFGDLSLEVIMEIIDDKLIHTELREECINFISSLETITVDIVSSILEEVNIHHESPQVFKDVFNVSAIKNVFNIYKLDENDSTKKELLHKEVRIEPLKITNENLDDSLYINGRYHGEIRMILENDVVIIGIPDEEENEKLHRYQIESAEKKHSAFSNYYAF